MWSHGKKCIQQILIAAILPSSDVTVDTIERGGMTTAAIFSPRLPRRRALPYMVSVFVVNINSRGIIPHIVFAVVVCTACIEGQFAPHAGQEEGIVVNSFMLSCTQRVLTRMVMPLLACILLYISTQISGPQVGAAVEVFCTSVPLLFNHSA